MAAIKGYGAKKLAGAKYGFQFISIGRQSRMTSQGWTILGLLHHFCHIRSLTLALLPSLCHIVATCHNYNYLWHSIVGRQSVVGEETRIFLPYCFCLPPLRLHMTVCSGMAVCSERDQGQKILGNCWEELQQWEPSLNLILTSDI